MEKKTNLTIQNISSDVGFFTTIKNLLFRFQDYTVNANNKSLSFFTTKMKIVK